MKCPHCEDMRSYVTNVKRRDDVVVRYRKCEVCQTTYKTEERIVSHAPRTHSGKNS